MTKLIAIYSPVPQCGKTTVASYLQANHGFRKVGFADPVRASAVDFIYRCAGGAYTYAEVEDFVYRNKRTPIEHLPSKPTARHICQVIGTELGRQCLSENFWVDIWLGWARQYLDAGVPVVCDDLRFLNEYDAVKRLDGEVWRITRPGVVVDPEAVAHVSEGGLEGLLIPDHLRNEGSLKDLEDFVEFLLHSTPRHTL